MSYSKEDDGSDLDAASWVAMRDALLDCIDAMDACNRPEIPPSYRMLLKQADTNARRALKLAGVNP